MLLRELHEGRRVEVGAGERAEGGDHHVLAVTVVDERLLREPRVQLDLIDHRLHRQPLPAEEILQVVLRMQSVSGCKPEPDREAT